MRLKEMLGVFGINSATLAAVTFADAEAALKVSLLTLTIFYTLIKIRNEIKYPKLRKDDEDEL